MNDSHLRNLNLWYRNQAPSLGVDSLVFAESQPMAMGRLVVDQTASDPGIHGVYPIALDADHASICKIEWPQETAYLKVKDFIRGKLDLLSKPIALAEERDDLALSLSVANVFEDIHEEKDYPKTKPQTLLYAADVSADGVTIRPVLGYAERVAEGGPVEAISYMWTPFRWLLPSLDLKVVNNSNETIVFDEASFEVERSTPVLVPLPVFMDRCVFNFFQIINEGWQDALNTRLDFSLFASRELVEFGGPYQHHLDVGTVSEDKDIDLSEFLSSMGVDVEALLHRRYTDATLGPFPEGVAFLGGEFAYEYPSTSGEIVRSSLKVSAAINLICPPPGIYGPPSHSYEVKLRSQGESYRVSLPISQNLKPGDADRFLVRVACKSASRHSLQVLLKFDGQTVLRSKPVELDLMITRIGAKLVRDLSED